ncbi:type II toxin-antitoxin system RelE/ParE family toxin [Bythopirellula polymerisocia]|uniref:type II toxin-antitoxin system RelE/ParE family toxin n=1 Tax=Bythopirellula polymerisocia TaxID=2528003 RepID=UPI001E5EDF15|nr:type II toxin-antitoxin system RelE/ParE family toxin [Bythopirellula polymerisocia]
MKEQRIRVYRTRVGKRPFSLWLEKLRDRRAQQRIDARLARIALGNFGDCKSVGDGVLELRIDYGPGYRFYLGRDGDEVVILLIGGDKQSQTKDISLAKDYWADYKVRKQEETNGANQ